MWTETIKCAYCESPPYSRCTTCGKSVCPRHGWQSRDYTICSLCILERSDSDSSVSRVDISRLFAFYNSCKSEFVAQVLSAAISLVESERTGMLGSGEILYALLNVKGHLAHSILATNPTARSQLAHKYDLYTFMEEPLILVTDLVLEALQIADRSSDPAIVLLRRCLRTSKGEPGSQCWEIMKSHGYDMDLVDRLVTSVEASIPVRQTGTVIILPAGDRLRVIPLDAFSNVPIADEEIPGLQDVQDFAVCYPEIIDPFPAGAIGELEHLINSPNIEESSLQDFFERYPSFLLGAEYSSAFPHLTLLDAKGKMIPDFVLSRIDTNLCDIMDIKLPTARIVTGQERRRQFSRELKDAIAQLREYHDYFDDSKHRDSFLQRYSLEAYKPNISVVIGRASEFRNNIERQKIQRDTAVRIVTYDDILCMARRRIAVNRGILKVRGHSSARS